MLWIFNENLRRVGSLRKYEMAQWNNKFRDIGTFSINARYVDENLFLLDKTKTYYVLLYMSMIKQKAIVGIPCIMYLEKLKKFQKRMMKMRTILQQ